MPQSVRAVLNCPHDAMKQFQNCLETVLFQFHFVMRTVLVTILQFDHSIAESAGVNSRRCSSEETAKGRCIRQTTVSQTEIC